MAYRVLFGGTLMSALAEARTHPVDAVDSIVRGEEALRLYCAARNLTQTAEPGKAVAKPTVEEARVLLNGLLEAAGPDEGMVSGNLHRWARSLADGHLTTARIYLDRAGLVLGIRPSDAIHYAQRPVSARQIRSKPKPQPQLRQPPQAPQSPQAPKPVSPKPVSSPPQPAPAAVSSAPRLSAKPGPAAPLAAPADDPLTPEERQLVARLPLSTQPLRGATELANCWGDTMSPTSARGRYSRLATKLEEAYGRPVLFRGRGCYARME
jgi:hypothetical protein